MLERNTTKNGQGSSLLSLETRTDLTTYGPDPLFKWTYLLLILQLILLLQQIRIHKILSF